MIRRMSACALWLIAVSALCFFENNAGTRAVLIASLILPSSSILCAWMASRRAAFSLSAPDVCQAGEDVVCRLNVRHAPRFADAAGTLAISHLMTGETASLDFPANQSLTLPPLSGGAVTLALQKAEIRDIFGLCRFPVHGETTSTLVVLPRLFDAHVFLDESTSPLSEGAFTPVVSSLSSGSDTTSFREYLPGDSVRRIHWKLSGKMDKTMLRETNEPPSFGVLLNLRTAFSEPPAPDATEETLSALFSVSHTLIQQGIPHFLSVENGMPIPISSESDWAQAMRQALVPSARFETGDALHFSHIGIFSPRPDTDAVSLFRENRVTLVLPESVGAYASPGIVRVAAFGKNQPLLEL